MVSGNHWVAYKDALGPVDAAADAAKEYSVGQDETMRHTVFVLPFQAGLRCHNFRWHSGPSTLKNGYWLFHERPSVGRIDVLGNYACHMLGASPDESGGAQWHPHLLPLKSSAGKVAYTYHIGRLAATDNMGSQFKNGVILTQ
jgi:hypothetical protein